MMLRKIVLNAKAVERAKNSLRTILARRLRFRLEPRIEVERPDVPHLTCAYCSGGLMAARYFQE